MVNNSHCQFVTKLESTLTYWPIFKDIIVVSINQVTVEWIYFFQINAFAKSCYRIMLNIKLVDHISNEAIFNMTLTIPLITRVRTQQLKFLGHVLCLHDDDLWKNMNCMFHRMGSVSQEGHAHCTWLCSSPPGREIIGQYFFSGPRSQQLEKSCGRLLRRRMMMMMTFLNTF